MKVTYDKTNDTAYIYFKEIIPAESTHVLSSQEAEFKNNFHFDFDADGRLIGFEVWAASKMLPIELLEKAEKI